MKSRIICIDDLKNKYIDYRHIKNYIRLYGQKKAITEENIIDFVESTKISVYKLESLLSHGAYYIFKKNCDILDKKFVKDYRIYGSDGKNFKKYTPNGYPRMNGIYNNAKLKIEQYKMKIFANIYINDIGLEDKSIIDCIQNLIDKLNNEVKQ